ncbi:MAG: hypothetical protein AVO33_11360 [delta proteobacterium ML8_F1]|nr:MAG: hypothetical protein AVO33_11360 [delta proteobacterium ML8_F1]
MRIKSLSVLVILAVFSLSSWAFGASSEVASIHIAIDIAEDNSLSIEESLKVRFFQTDLHGIIRRIPRRTYYGKPVQISKLEVIGAPYDTGTSGDFFEVKIGDPDVFARETENYTIRYLYEIGEDGDESMDEVYFNLIGPDWTMPLKDISFDILLPKDFDPRDVTFTHGRVGSVEGDRVIYTVEGRRISGALTGSLAPGEALTLALPLEEGYFEPREEIDIYGFLRKGYPFLMPVCLLLGAFLKGRFRNHQLFPTVEFYPPGKLTPAELGYIYDHQVNPYDLTAMLIYWAHGGHMKIIEREETAGVIFKRDKKRILFEKLEDLPESAPSFEKAYFNELFDQYGADGLVDSESLEKTFYQTVARVSQLLKDSFKTPGRRLYARQGYVILAIIVFLAIVEFFMFFSGTLSVVNPYAPGLVTLFSLLLAATFTGLVAVAARQFSLIKTRLPRQRVMTGLLAVTLLLVAVVLLLGYSFVVTVPGFYLLAVASAFILLFMTPYMKLRTAFGDDILAKILGFRNFIENAEKDRIHALAEEDPTYFYRVLPYAMVLGVTDIWARRFESMVTEAPGWYENTGGGRFSAIYFTRQLNRTTATVSRAMTSTPRQTASGGSSGGGFSGGGSGGGGGSAW